jgi:hypothetical protein
LESHVSRGQHRHVSAFGQARSTSLKFCTSHVARVGRTQHVSHRAHCTLHVAVVEVPKRIEV